MAVRKTLKQTCSQFNCNFKQANKLFLCKTLTLPPSPTQLAAAQRMSTDVRRAVFVAVMGSDDCLEAYEKLMRLPIKVRLNREACGAAHNKQA